MQRDLSDADCVSDRQPWHVPHLSTPSPAVMQCVVWCCRTLSALRMAIQVVCVVPFPTPSHNSVPAAWVAGRIHMSLQALFWEDTIPGMQVY